MDALQFVVAHPFVSLFCGLLSFVILAIFKHNYYRFVQAKAQHAPPLVSGFLPFVGCAVAFGKGPPVNFIKQCISKHGDVFTLHMAGQSMTYIMNPDWYDIFFHGKPEQVSFTHATQPFLEKGFGVSMASYSAYHMAALESIRSTLAASNIGELTTTLSLSIRDYLLVNASTSGDTNLAALTEGCLFQTTMKQLFGTRCDDAPSLLKTFHTFDKLFELACSPLPQVLLRSWRAARAKLKQMLSGVADAGLAGDVARAVLAKVQDESTSSWLLAIMWASEANALPAAMWSVLMIASKPKVYEKMQREVDEAARSNEGVLTSRELGTLVYTRACVQEAVRLRSPGVIVRQTMQPTPVGAYIVPAGHMLCLSPIWAHRQRAVWGANVEDFEPERFVGTQPPRAYIAFGSGKYRCPGQSLALAELTAFVAQLFLHFDVKLSGPMPEAMTEGLVGVPHPATAPMVTLTRRA
eukprot:TRINITY_DN10437_c0_g1_i1.p1 TRINITY_DN10437_c0_g1~~TRINITY_DN10437_c0_g1_i1.p1  ORF type:complete len:466 (-),score=79.30 TRINITY_DN10437_c0_g1_i1:1072-2469(-)